MRLYFLIILLLLSVNLIAGEVQDTFVIDIHDHFVSVVSPNKLVKNMYAIVKNRTLTTITGHIQSPDGEWKSYFSLKSEKTLSIKLNVENYGSFVLFSQSPPFQEVKLEVGKKVYEIPPQKKY